MTLNYAVPIGKIKFVLYDDRPDSPTRGQLEEFFLGPENYHLVVVPPGIWNGFKGLGTVPSLIANCPDIPHRADEIMRLDPFSPTIRYNWDIRHG